MLDKQKKIRINKEIDDILKLRCKELSMNESEYIRAIIELESTIQYLSAIKEFKEELKATNKELHQLGINLNQLTRIANKQNFISEKMQVEIVEFREKIINLLKFLGSI